MFRAVWRARNMAQCLLLQFRHMFCKKFENLRSRRLPARVVPLPLIKAAAHAGMSGVSLRSVWQVAPRLRLASSDVDAGVATPVEKRTPTDQRQFGRLHLAPGGRPDPPFMGRENRTHH